MTPVPIDAVDGRALAPVVAAAREPDAGREPLYRALLAQPLCLAWLAPDAPPGPHLRLESGECVRLVEAPSLRVPVPPLYVSRAAMVTAARARGYWPDGVARGAVLEAGAAFPLLREQPGALVVTEDGPPLPLDAGEIAALAERQTPDEYHQAVRGLVARSRGREAARLLARRPLYVLGHPRGGLLLFQREIPAFFHLAAADRFAAGIAAQTGEKPEHGLVGAADLFRTAFRGRLDVLIDPGPQSIRLRAVELRV